MEGKSGFPPPRPQSPPCAGRIECAHTHTCVSLCVCVCEALGTPGSLLCALSSLPTHTRPSLLACDHSGHRQHGTASGSNDAWGEASTPALPLQADIFHVLCLGEGHFEVYIGFRQSWKWSCKSNRDQLMICNQGFLGV